MEDALAPSRHLLPTEDSTYRHLRCPRCHNAGEHTFNAGTFVLIGGDGVPTYVGSYVENPDAVIDCHGCDFKGPLQAFAERHRPAERASHRAWRS